MPLLGLDWVFFVVEMFVRVVVVVERLVWLPCGGGLIFRNGLGAIHGSVLK